MNRVDVLPRHRPALRHLGERVLAAELDPVLQALVERASRELAMPIALVSLVLDRVQLFRAHVGLPADLASACATDRDVSFCQFVVRDEAMFEVSDALSDARVPEALVRGYGIRAYLGAPIRLGGAVLGSACVIGVEPRAFSDEDRTRLQAIADEVSARLEALALDERALERALHERAVRPAFAELRNLLQPIVGNFSEMRVAAAELGAVGRLLGHIVATGTIPTAASVLVRAREAAAELEEVIADTAQATSEVQDALVALERASVEAATGAIADIVAAATTLAHHRAKLVRGVAWTGAEATDHVDVPRPVAVSVLAAALGAMAAELVNRRVRSGLRGAVAVAGDDVVFALTSPALDGAWIDDLVATLRTLVGGDRGIAIAAHGDRLDVTMRRVAA